MQYKALEISFREHFEKVTLDLIKTGVLQEKLDLIGYARPIPKAMEEFEKYIGSLPIIKEIPFFSRSLNFERCYEVYVNIDPASALHLTD